MGRGRVELRRIKDKASRQVSFSKRKSGLLKKANELAVLWEADVGLIIFSAKGKLYEYSSAPSMESIIQRYREFSDAERDVHKYNLEAQKQQIPNASETKVEEFASQRSNAELKDIAQRFPESPAIWSETPESSTHDLGSKDIKQVDDIPDLASVALENGSA